MAGQPREQSQPALAPEPEMPEEAKGRGYDGRNPSGRGGHEEGESSRERDPPGLGPSRKRRGFLWRWCRIGRLLCAAVVTN